MFMSGLWKIITYCVFSNYSLIYGMCLVGIIGLCNLTITILFGIAMFKYLDENELNTWVYVGLLLSIFLFILLSVGFPIVVGGILLFIGSTKFMKKAIIITFFEE